MTIRSFAQAVQGVPATEPLTALAKPKSERASDEEWVSSRGATVRHESRGSKAQAAASCRSQDIGRLAHVSHMVSSPTNAANMPTSRSTNWKPSIDAPEFDPCKGWSLKSSKLHNTTSESDSFGHYGQAMTAQVPHHQSSNAAPDSAWPPGLTDQRAGLGPQRSSGTSPRLPTSPAAFSAEPAVANRRTVSKSVNDHHSPDKAKRSQNKPKLGVMSIQGQIPMKQQAVLNKEQNLVNHAKAPSRQIALKQISSAGADPILPPNVDFPALPASPARSTSLLPRDARETRAFVHFETRPPRNATGTQRAVRAKNGSPVPVPAHTQVQNSPGVGSTTKPRKSKSKNSPKHDNKPSDPVVPDNRGLLGAEHELMRRMLESATKSGPAGRPFASARGTRAAPLSGRQRLRPRTKKFTSLKKKVLQERLRKWRVANPENRPESNSGNVHLSATVCVNGFADVAAVGDSDEREELTSNLHDMAVLVGPVRRFYVPDSFPEEATAKSCSKFDQAMPCFVEFEQVHDASAAVSCWHGMQVAGENLSCHQLMRDVENGNTDDNDESDQIWRTWCWQQLLILSSGSVGGLCEIALDNVLTDDDLEDDECLQETKSDVRNLAAKFGTVVDIREDRDTRRLVVSFERTSIGSVNSVAQELQQKMLGGTAVDAVAITSDGFSPVAVVLMNVLTEDDLDDPECLNESLNDIRELANSFGTAETVEAVPGPQGPHVVRIVFKEGREAADAAVTAFEGMKIGGTNASAVLDATDAGKIPPDNPQGGAQATDSPKPMYSGDKLVPERFAECKRVPKVPNTGETAREFIRILGDEAKVLVIDMLGELSRLQKRAMEDEHNKNAKARRRLVMGLREVARGIRAHKVKMVIMANNEDEYGALDEKLQEIVTSAATNDVPILFELSRRQLGRAMGKSIKVAVVGIQNAEGAHQQFKKLTKMAQ